MPLPVHPYHYTGFSQRAQIAYRNDTNVRSRASVSPTLLKAIEAVLYGYTQQSNAHHKGTPEQIALALAIVITHISEVHSLPPEEVKSTRGTRGITDARHMIWAWSREHLRLSTGLLGAIFERDHSTIVQSRHAHKGLVANNPEYRALWKRSIADLLPLVNEAFRTNPEL